MNKDFSLRYGNRYFSSASVNPAETPEGAVYALDDCVRITQKITSYPEADALEWVLYFENVGKDNSPILSDIRDADVLLPFDTLEKAVPGFRPEAGFPAVITMNGMEPGDYYWENDRRSAREYGFTTEYLGKSQKTKTFENVSGRSSDGMMPFFDVTANGEGYIAAIGWTGDWRASFTLEEKGIRVVTGLKETGFYLKPGEKLRTSSILFMRYEKGEDKYNKFRSLIRRHYSHCLAGSKREGLLAAELWGGLPSAEMIKRIREFKERGIGFEDIWIDAGWYGNCTNCNDAFSGDWSIHTGEWEVNKRVHPGELKDVAEEAEKAGMHLMLWIEPERAVNGTRLTKEHPYWFLTLPGAGSSILDYGNEEAWQYVYDLVAGYAENLHLSCYRQDFNTDLTSYFRENDEENRRGITEIYHITGMYRLWDALHARFPELLIDNCSSGGRRIDIETVRRAIAFFRSDYQCNFNADPEVLQVHNAGIQQYLPYNGCTNKTKSDTYSIRSSYSSSWGGAFYNAYFQSMDEADFAWAKKTLDEYRSIRRYFSRDFHNLGSAVYDETAWTIFQYHDPEDQSGVILAFRRSASPFASAEVALKGLEEGRYCYENADTGVTTEGGRTVRLVIDEIRGSLLIRYRRK